MEHGSSVKPRPESDLRFPVPEQAVQPIQVFPLSSTSNLRQRVVRERLDHSPSNSRQPSATRRKTDSGPAVFASIHLRSAPSTPTCTGNGGRGLRRKSARRASPPAWHLQRPDRESIPIAEAEGVMLASDALSRYCVSYSRKPGHLSCRIRLTRAGTRPSASTIARTQSEKASQSRYSCCAWKKRSQGTRNNWRVARRRASSCTLRSALPGRHCFGLFRVRPTLCFTERPIT